MVCIIRIIQKPKCQKKKVTNISIPYILTSNKVSWSPFWFSISNYPATCTSPLAYLYFMFWLWFSCRLALHGHCAGTGTLNRSRQACFITEIHSVRVIYPKQTTKRLIPNRTDLNIASIPNIYTHTHSIKWCADEALLPVRHRWPIEESIKQTKKKP